VPLRLANPVVVHEVMIDNAAGARKQLTPLVGRLPEARLNLVIYLLRKGKVAQAHDLIRDLEPSLPQVMCQNTS
jgi:intraflagellar transport protein 56